MRTTFPLLFAVILSTQASAQTTKSPPPGARAGDKQMTCPAVAAERAEITAAAGKRASAQQVAAKRKHAAFGFLKTIAAGIVPGQALGLGGVAGQAGYLASSQALAPGSTGEAAPTATASAQTKEETDRLGRLDEIAAYRSCAN